GLADLLSDVNAALAATVAPRYGAGLVLTAQSLADLALGGLPQAVRDALLNMGGAEGRSSSEAFDEEEFEAQVSAAVGAAAFATHGAAIRAAAVELDAYHFSDFVTASLVDGRIVLSGPQAFRLTAATENGSLLGLAPDSE